MNYSKIKWPDVANGPGCRVSLFVSGCKRHCKNCFNDAAWRFDAGKEYNYTVMRSIIDIMRSPRCSGLSILGGEPFEDENISSVSATILYAKLHFPEKPVWVYSGYTYEELVARRISAVDFALHNADVLVDGPFVEELHDPSLAFRGSSNQRIIDLKKTNETGRVVLFEMPAW